MQKDADQEMRAAGRRGTARSRVTRDSLALNCQKLLLPTDPLDNSNIFLEIRAAPGAMKRRSSRRSVPHVPRA